MEVRFTEPRLRLAVSHRLRRMVVLLGAIPALFRRRPAASLTVRRSRYLWSRLTQLHRRPARYRVVSIRRLDRSAAASSEHAVWEVRLHAPLGRRHRVGDTILLRWRNAPERVEDVLVLLGADGEEHRALVGHSSVFQPGRLCYGSLRELLAQEVDLHVASDQILSRVPTGTPLRPTTAVPDPVWISGAGPGPDGGPPTPEPRRGSGPVPAPIPGRGVDLLSALRTASPPISVAELLAAQPRTTARAYSISRIQHGRLRDTVEIIVSAVMAPVKMPHGPLVRTAGRATAYVAHLSTATSVRAWSVRHPWRLDVIDDRPMILIVCGTGIAGALAWLRRRRSAGNTARNHTGRNRSPVWLIYGVRDWHSHGLYQEELLAMTADGTIDRLDVAQSRSDIGGFWEYGNAALHHHSRVTNVITVREHMVASHVHAGAGIYVSGPKALGRASRSLLHDLVVRRGIAHDAPSGKQLLAAWEASGRLQISVS